MGIHTTNLFAAAAESLTRRNGRIPTKQFAYLLPGVLDYLSSSLCPENRVFITYQERDIVTLVSPSIVLADALGKVSMWETNDLRDKNSVRHLGNTLERSDFQAIVIRRGGGYGKGPIVAYATRPDAVIPHLEKRATL